MNISYLNQIFNSTARSKKPAKELRDNDETEENVEITTH